MAVSTVFKGNHELVNQLQELKENQTTLLAYQDHLEAVVGNLTSSNENLVRSHSNQSRSCDVFINENQDLKTELTELKEANRLTDTCAQKTIDTYCRPQEGQSPSKIKLINMLIFYLAITQIYLYSPPTACPASCFVSACSQCVDLVKLDG